MSAMVEMSMTLRMTPAVPAFIAFSEASASRAWMICTSGVTLCSAQNSSISCVTLAPPMSEPSMRVPEKIMGNAATLYGVGTPPSIVMMPVWALSVEMMALMSWTWATVLTMWSKVRKSLPISSASVYATISAPSAAASAFLERDREKTVTLAPMATASLTAIMPRPPRPTTPTVWSFLPLVHRAKGAYVVTPAQHSGPACSSFMPSGTV
mmetsp:Transcript_19487/g.66837  ORF Transcript_19487/g.66837 Transcript_19487/m.66837 type:complete len:210 (-) Transcript_19487:547-1176(-)